MSDVTTKRCDADGCGKLRINDANHWFIGIVTEDMIAIGKIDSTDAVFDSSKVNHFCGAACAQRWFAGELQKLQH